MLNVVFINTCFTILLNNNNKIKQNNQLYRDLFGIIDYYADHRDIPISLQNSVDCALELCRLRMSGKTPETTIDSIIQSQKFKDIESTLLECFRRKLDDSEIYGYVSQVRKKKKMVLALSNYKQIMGFFQELDTGNSLDETADKYDIIVKTMYSDLMESNRVIEIESSASIDPLKDRETGIAQKIKQKYAPGNRVPSGFKVFDEIVLGGGFSKSRVYIFGGAAGSGKSTLMLNICEKSASLPKRPKNLPDGCPKVFLYVTLEDQVDESYLKLYQVITKKTQEDALLDINNNIDIEGVVTEYFKRHNSTIIFKYYPSKSISPMDVNAAIDDVTSTYPQQALQMVVVDYLDLLLPDVSTGEKRHDLGDIVLSLKTISIKHEVPILSPTQLNREAYNEKMAGHDLGVGMMGESMQKVHNADYISMQIVDANDDTLVHFKVGKNRAGKKNIVFSFRADFSKCLFIRATLSDKPANSIAHLPEHMKIPVSGSIIPQTGPSLTRRMTIPDNSTQSSNFSNEFHGATNLF